MRFIIFIISSAIFLFALDNTAGAKETKTPLTINAYIHIPYESQILEHGKTFCIRLRYHNATTNEVCLESWGHVGKEGFIKDPFVPFWCTNNNNTFVIYEDKMVVTFIAWDKKEESHEFAYPLEACFDADQYILSMLQIPAPSRAGVYKMVISVKPRNGEAKYSFMPSQNKEVETNIIRVRPNEITHPALETITFQ